MQADVNWRPQDYSWDPYALVAAPAHQKPVYKSTSSHVKEHAFCQVRGCNKDLTGDKAYFRRHRICEKHLKSEQLLVDGIMKRFCQQCGCFHDLREFDGNKRSCRSQLAKHNARRRKRGAEPESNKRARPQIMEVSSGPQLSNQATTTMWKARRASSHDDDSSGHTGGPAIGHGISPGAMARANAAAAAAHAAALAMHSNGGHPRNGGRARTRQGQGSEEAYTSSCSAQASAQPHEGGPEVTGGHRLLHSGDNTTGTAAVGSGSGRLVQSGENSAKRGGGIGMGGSGGLNSNPLSTGGFDPFNVPSLDSSDLRSLLGSTPLGSISDGLSQQNPGGAAPYGAMAAHLGATPADVDTLLHTLAMQRAAGNQMSHVQLLAEDWSAQAQAMVHLGSSTQALAHLATAACAVQQAEAVEASMGSGGLGLHHHHSGGLGGLGGLPSSGGRPGSMTLHMGIPSGGLSMGIPSGGSLGSLPSLPVVPMSHTTITTTAVGGWPTTTTAVAAFGVGGSGGQGGSGAHHGHGLQGSVAARPGTTTFVGQKVTSGIPEQMTGRSNSGGGSSGRLQANPSLGSHGSISTGGRGTGAINGTGSGNMGTAASLGMLVHQMQSQLQSNGSMGQGGNGPSATAWQTAADLAASQHQGGNSEGSPMAPPAFQVKPQSNPFLVRTASTSPSLSTQQQGSENPGATAMMMQRGGSIQSSLSGGAQSNSHHSLGHAPSLSHSQGNSQGQEPRGSMPSPPDLHMQLQDSHSVETGQRAQPRHSAGSPAGCAPQQSYQVDMAPYRAMSPVPMPTHSQQQQQAYSAPSPANSSGHSQGYSQGHPGHATAQQQQQEQYEQYPSPQQHYQQQHSPMGPATATATAPGGGAGAAASSFQVAQQLASQGGHHAQYDAQDILYRVSLKISNCTPDQLPPEMHARLLDWVSKADALLMQGFIRPGCTHLIVDVAQPLPLGPSGLPLPQALLGPAGSASQGSEALASLLAHLLGGQLAAANHVLLQCGGLSAAVDHGKPAAAPQLARPELLPTITRVSPLALVAGAGTRLKFEVRGQGLLREGVALHCRSQGKDLQLLAARPLTELPSEGEEGSDEEQRVEVALPRLKRGALVMVEAAQGRLLGGWQPLLLVEDPQVAEEVNGLAEVAMEPSRLAAFLQDLGQVVDMVAAMKKWLHVGAQAEQAACLDESDEAEEGAEGEEEEEEEEFEEDLPFPDDPEEDGLELLEEGDEQGQEDESAPATAATASTAASAAAVDALSNTNSLLSDDTAYNAEQSAPATAAAAAAMTNAQQQVGLVPPSLSGAHRHVLDKACGLLAFAIDRAMPATAQMVLSFILAHGVSLAQLDAAMAAHSTNKSGTPSPSGLTILHHAARSASPDMLRLVMGWALRFGHRWSLTAPGPAGVTPLHLAAALPGDAGMAMARYMLEVLPGAVQLWLHHPAADGCTSADYARQQGHDALNKLAFERYASAAFAGTAAAASGMAAPPTGGKASGTAASGAAAATTATAPAAAAGGSSSAQQRSNADWSAFRAEAAASSAATAAAAAANAATPPAVSAAPATTTDADLLNRAGGVAPAVDVAWASGPVRPAGVVDAAAGATAILAGTATAGDDGSNELRFMSAPIEQGTPVGLVGAEGADSAGATCCGGGSKPSKAPAPAEPSSPTESVGSPMLLLPGQAPRDLLPPVAVAPSPNKAATASSDEQPGSSGSLTSNALAQLESGSKKTETSQWIQSLPTPATASAASTITAVEQEGKPLVASALSAPAAAEPSQAAAAPEAAGKEEGRCKPHEPAAPADAAPAPATAAPQQQSQAMGMVAGALAVVAVALFAAGQPLLAALLLVVLLVLMVLPRQQ